MSGGAPGGSMVVSNKGLDSGVVSMNYSESEQMHRS